MHLLVAILQSGDTLVDGLSEERRALPGQRLGERSARYVLGNSVQESGERHLLGSGRPEAGEHVVGPATEQQGVHRLGSLEHDSARLAVPERRVPSAVAEATVAIRAYPGLEVALGRLP